MARPKTNSPRNNHLNRVHTSLSAPLTASHSLPSNARFTDDLIRSLANSYENKRARQVGEWERAQAVTKRPSR